jgi:hypothetical protein
MVNEVGHIIIKVNCKENNISIPKIKISYMTYDMALIMYPN